MRAPALLLLLVLLAVFFTAESRAPKGRRIKHRVHSDFAIPSRRWISELESDVELARPSSKPSRSDEADEEESDILRYWWRYDDAEESDAEMAKPARRRLDSEDEESDAEIIRHYWNYDDEEEESDADMIRRWWPQDNTEESDILRYWWHYDDAEESDAEMAKPSRRHYDSEEEEEADIKVASSIIWNPIYDDEEEESDMRFPSRYYKRGLRKPIMNQEESDFLAAIVSMLQKKNGKKANVNGGQENIGKTQQPLCSSGKKCRNWTSV